MPVGKGHKISTEALVFTSRKVISISENMWQILPPLGEAQLFTTSKVKNTISCLRKSTGWYFLSLHSYLHYVVAVYLSLLQCGCALPIYCRSKLYLDLKLNIMLSFCLGFDILNLPGNTVWKGGQMLFFESLLSQFRNQNHLRTADWQLISFSLSSNNYVTISN